MKRLRWIGLTLFLVVIAYVIGSLRHFHSLRDLDGVQGIEEERISDPTGQFDAVLLRESWGGAAGSLNWYACIVQKGRPAVSAREAVMIATNFRNAKLVWQRPHLIEVRYERAEILEFTNLWGSNVLKAKGPFSGEEPFWVEIRLVPSSPDFSILTPDGAFE